MSLLISRDLPTILLRDAIYACDTCIDCSLAFLAACMRNVHEHAGLLAAVKSRSAVLVMYIFTAWRNR